MKRLLQCDDAGPRRSMLAFISTRAPDRTSERKLTPQCTARIPNSRRNSLLTVPQTSLRKKCGSDEITFYSGTIGVGNSILRAGHAQGVMLTRWEARERREKASTVWVVLVVRCRQSWDQDGVGRTRWEDGAAPGEYAVKRRRVVVRDETDVCPRRS